MLHSDIEIRDLGINLNLIIVKMETKEFIQETMLMPANKQAIDMTIFKANDFIIYQKFLNNRPIFFNVYIS